MYSLVREFKELEATSQLPPSTLRQRVTPTTVLLPAAVVGPPCAAGGVATMPHLSPTITSSASTMMSPQGSTQMCVAPVFGLGSVPGSPLLNGSTTVQSVTDNYPDAHVHRVSSGVSALLDTLHVHTALAARSAGEDSAFGPLTPDSSTTTSRLSHSTQESLLVVNYTPAQACTTGDATSSANASSRMRSCSRHSNQSDSRLDQDQRPSTISSFPHTYKHPQQLCSAIGAPFTRVVAATPDPGAPSIPGERGAAQRVAYRNPSASLLAEIPDIMCAAHSLTHIMDSVTTTSPSAPVIPPADVSQGETNSECKSMFAKKNPRPQASKQKQPTLQMHLLPSTASITDSASVTSQTNAHAPLSLQRKKQIRTGASAIPGGYGGGEGSGSTLSSPLPTRPLRPSPPCLPGSGAKPSTNAVGVKPNGGQGGPTDCTSAATATAAAAAVFAPCRLASSPTPSATTTSPSTTPPPPPPSLQSICLGGIPGTIAFLPLEVQPDITTTTPSIRTISAYRSPARAAFGASGDTATSASATNTVLSLSSLPTMAMLEQPSQASADSLAAATPPPPLYSVSPTTQPLQPSAYVSFPCMPTGSLTMFLATPEVNWQPLAGGVANQPATTVGGTGCGLTDRCSSPTSTATPQTVSPRTLTTSSLTLEPQRASGSRSTTWASSGQTYRNVILHSGGAASGSAAAGVTAAVTSSVSGYSHGIPFFHSQAQLLCTPVPLDDTESLCAICLEGQVLHSNTGDMHTTTTPSSTPPLLLRRPVVAAAAEEDTDQNSENDSAVRSSATIPGEEVEHGAVRGVKPGSRLLSLPCGHCYHQNCVQRWLMESQSCPTCRRDLSRDATVN